MAKDKTKDKKKKKETAAPVQADLITTEINPNTHMLGGNIFDGKPDKGEVIIVLTKEERDAMRSISFQMDAISDATDVPYGKALEVREAWSNAWGKLFEQSPQVNPAWPMRVDFFTGLVYISE